MNQPIRVILAACSFLLLANFSSQDSTSSNNKPAVNFYGCVTDTSEKTFKAENITFERMYKQMPAYQEPPKTATAEYDPTVNLTRLDLAEIKVIEFPQNQTPQKYNNRYYIVMDVYSDARKTLKNSYIIEADKKLTCEQVNEAGPIEKEIKLKAVKKIVIDGFKQSAVLDSDSSKKPASNKPTMGAQAPTPKRKQLLTYLKGIFTFGTSA